MRLVSWFVVCSFVLLGVFAEPPPLEDARDPALLTNFIPANHRYTRAVLYGLKACALNQYEGLRAFQEDEAEKYPYLKLAGAIELPWLDIYAWTPTGDILVHHLPVTKISTQAEIEHVLHSCGIYPFSLLHIDD